MNRAISRVYTHYRAEGVLSATTKAFAVLKRKAVAFWSSTGWTPLLIWVLQQRTKKEIDRLLLLELVHFIKQNQLACNVFAFDSFYYALAELRPWLSANNKQLFHFRDINPHSTSPSVIIGFNNSFSKELALFFRNNPSLSILWQSQGFYIATNIAVNTSTPPASTQSVQNEAFFNNYKDDLNTRLSMHEQDTLFKGPLNLQFHVRPFTYDIFIIQEVFSQYVQPISAAQKTSPFKTIVDIGGQIGSFSLFLSTLFPKAQVLTFEPEPGNFELLQKNIRTNNKSNISAYQMAVSNKIGHADFYISNSDTGGHRLEIPDSSSEDNKLTVPITTLEKIFKEHSLKSIDLLKIDVEGSELRVLQGGKEFLRNHVRQVFVETGQGVLGGSMQDVIDLLQEANFGLEIQGDAGLTLIYGQNKGLQ